MKIIAVSGSPRNGNTDWMLTTVLAAAGSRAASGAGGGAQTELLLLRQADLRPCRGCLACEKRDRAGRGVCRITDDMREILPRLLAADVIVLGTPAYMGLLSGLLKGFLDRTCPVWPALRGKRIAGVAVAEEGVGAALRNLRTYGELLAMRWLGGVAALAKGPKDAARQPALRRRLERLGRRLASPDG